MVLEHPEVPVEAHIHRARLNHARIERLDPDLPGFHQTPNIPIREQHPPNATAPRPHSHHTPKPANLLPVASTPTTRM
ncbi:hypothetical protein GCM10022221_19320 [Actinocorallia aurea]